MKYYFENAERKYIAERNVTRFLAKTQGFHMINSLHQISEDLRYGILHYKDSAQHWIRPICSPPKHSLDMMSVQMRNITPLQRGKQTCLK